MSARSLCVLLPLCPAGVAPEKIRAVPQGIDAADFDPAKHQPLVLKAMPSAQLVTGTDNGTAAALEKPYGASHCKADFPFLPAARVKLLRPSDWL